MVKLVGVIILLMCGIFSGLAVAEKYLKRVQFLKLYINFLVYLKNEIQYTQKPILEILKNFSSTDFLDLCLRKFAENLKVASLDKAWQDAFKNNLYVTGLLQEERQAVLNFANMFGKCDVIGQINYLNYSLKIFDGFLKNAVETQKSKSKLPIILGAGISLCIAIIFM